MNRWMTAALFASVLSGAACADTFTHKEAKIEITVPAGWTHSENGDQMEITAPDKKQHVVFFMTPKSDKVTDALDQGLEKAIGKVDWEEKPEHETLNGMEAEVWEGTVTKGDAKIEVEAAYIDTPADKYLVVYWLSEPGSDKALEKDIDTIVKGIKPVK